MGSFSSRALCVATLACFSVACSSSDDPGTDPGGTDDPEMTDPEMTDPEMTDPEMTDPTEACSATGDIPCFEDIGEPCTNLDSGFVGDEYCMLAPEPGIGHQIHVGPDDYTDPDETNRYMIMPGEETNWAEITRTPNTETVYTNGYVSHMRPGSHHFILYSISEDLIPEESGPETSSGEGAESAVGALGGTFEAGATRAVQNALQLSDHPDDQGIGAERPAQQPIAVNLHFINTSEEPLLQEIWVNFKEIPREEIRLWSRPITWYGGLSMNIPPATDELLKNQPGSCNAPADNIRVLGATGHVHASTVRYNATFKRGGAGEEEILFEDYDWGEPTEFRYNHSTDNPAPDPVTGTPGGQTGVFLTGTADEFYWECEVQNRSGGYLRFSNEVYTGEMCNVFGFYASENASAGNWFCAF